MSKIRVSVVEDLTVVRALLQYIPGAHSRLAAIAEAITRWTRSQEPILIVVVASVLGSKRQEPAGAACAGYGTLAERPWTRLVIMSQLTQLPGALVQLIGEGAFCEALALPAILPAQLDLVSARLEMN